MKKLLLLILSLILTSVLIACSGGDGKDTTAGTDADTDAGTGAETHGDGEKLDELPELSDVKSVTVDTSVEHQTIESFGASGAWWAQTVGGNEKTREKVAKLLFDPVKGIGLNSYRYNIGAGSADFGNMSSGGITDGNRRAYSFETAPGEYDWSRDANAVWFMYKAAELGVDEIVMFCNSPLERLTKNGKAYGEAGYVSNIAPENYAEFAKYVLDVAEHFKADGLPIKYVSPINEPAFEWAGGQEGCHYEPDEVIALLRVFVEEIGKREGLDGVEISGPEGSSWRNSPSRWEDDTLGLCMKIMEDEVLGQYFTSLDAHSYWSTTDAKTTFARTFTRKFPNVKLRETEWCEMTTGNMKSEKDLSIGSGIVLAKQVHEDLTILDCVSWSFWTAVSFGEYRDGLIYTDAQGNAVQQLPKRYYTLGNYSRFIDRGYTRVNCTSGAGNVLASAYTGTNENGEDEIVIVLINDNTESVNIDFPGIDASKYNRISVNVTDRGKNLAETTYAEYVEGAAITIPKTSVTTIVISAKK